jgi:hypothetical protein
MTVGTYQQQGAADAAADLPGCWAPVSIGLYLPGRRAVAAGGTRAAAASDNLNGLPDAQREALTRLNKVLGGAK